MLETLESSFSIPLSFASLNISIGFKLKASSKPISCDSPSFSSNIYLLLFLCSFANVSRASYFLYLCANILCGLLSHSLVDQIFSRQSIHMAGRRKLVQTKRLPYANGILIRQPNVSARLWSQRPSAGMANNIIGLNIYSTSAWAA